MMLKYISGLKDLFEVQPQFFTSTDPKNKTASVGALGRRLFIVEKAGTIEQGDGEKQMQYVDALNVAAVDGSIDVDDKTMQFKYPEGSPVLTPDEVAAVGAPKRDLVKFTGVFNELVPKSQLFHVPGTIKGLRVPGEEAWALININKGKLHMRVAPSVGELDNAQEVPISECGTVEGDHMFPVPLALIKKPLELDDKAAYGFVLDDDGNYYFIARGSTVLCVYSCMHYKPGEAVESSVAPEIVEEEAADVEEPVEEAPVEESTEEAPAEEEGPEESPEEPADAASDADESDGDDGADDDSGGEEGDGDSVGDGSDSVGTDAETPEPPKSTESDDLPLMETLDEEMKELGRRVRKNVREEMIEFERMRKNIAKQVRPLAKKADKTPDTDELKKKLAEAEADAAAKSKKLTAIKQELAPYKDLLKINWKLLD